MKMKAHIEPKQGEMKRFHGLERAKFWGKEKMNIQAMLTGIAVNLKRFIKMSGIYVKDRRDERVVALKKDRKKLD